MKVQHVCAALALGCAVLPGRAAGQTLTCDSLDIDAGDSIIENFLGADILAHSMYNTTKEWRANDAQYLLDLIFGGTLLGGIGDDFVGELTGAYVPGLVGYVAPGVLGFILAIFVALPAMFARCCCAHCCCKPHHPLWGQQRGTLEDYPMPKCCGCSRASNDQKVGDAVATVERPVRTYTILETYLPVGAYLLFAIGIIILSSAGMSATAQVVAGIKATLCSVTKLLEEAQEFTNGLAGAVTDMLGVAIDALNNTAEIVNDAQSVSVTMNNVYESGNSALEQIDALIQRTVSGYDYDGSSVSSALSQLQSASVDLDNTLDLVNTELVSPRETILGIVDALAGVTNTTDGVFDSIFASLYEDEIEVPEIPFFTDGEPLQGIAGGVELMEDNSSTLGISFFVLAIISLPFTVFGILIMGPKCGTKEHSEKTKTCFQCCGVISSRFACVMLWLTLFISSLPAMALFVVSALMSDFCVVLEYAGQNFGSFVSVLLGDSLGDDSGGGSGGGSGGSSDGGDELFDLSNGVEDLVDACFEDESLLDALNITGTIVSYIDLVDFSILDEVDVANLIDIDAVSSQLDEVSARIDIYTILSPFNATDQASLVATCADCSGIAASATSINKLPFHDEDIPDVAAQALDATCGSSALACASTTEIAGGYSCDSFRQMICDLSSNVTDLTADLAVIQGHFSDVDTGLNSIYTDMIQLRNELLLAASNITSLADSVTDLNSFASCGFIADFYYSTVTGLCPGSVGGLLGLSMSLNVLLLFLVGLIIIHILVNCRLGGVGQPDHHTHIKNLAPAKLAQMFAQMATVQRAVRAFKRGQGVEMAVAVKAADESKSEESQIAKVEEGLAGEPPKDGNDDAKAAGETKPADTNAAEKADADADAGTGATATTNSGSSADATSAEATESKSPEESTTPAADGNASAADSAADSAEASKGKDDGGDAPANVDVSKPDEDAGASTAEATSSEPNTSAGEDNGANAAVDKKEADAAGEGEASASDEKAATDAKPASESDAKSTDDEKPSGNAEGDSQNADEAKAAGSDDADAQK